METEVQSLGFKEFSILFYKSKELRVKGGLGPKEALYGSGHKSVPCGSSAPVGFA